MFYVLTVNKNSQKTKNFKVINTLHYSMVLDISLIRRKPVFGVCDKGRLEPACAATEARYRLGISDIETRGIILSRQRTTKTPIRLRGCAGISASLLVAYGINRFSHDVAHITRLSDGPQLCI